MTSCQYCTPEWLEETARIYGSDPNLEEKLKKLSAKMCFRIKAEPAWGIEKDIIFGTFIESGKLTKITFFSEADARRESDYLLAATPQEWKKVLRKGNKVTVLGLAPYAPTVIDALTQVQIQFPDEMSAEELTKYRAYMEEFRKNMNV
jgi:hypothetical protein